MANAAYIEFYDDQGAKIDGGVKISGREGTVEALSFNHEIRIPTDAQSGALTGTRKHRTDDLHQEVRQIVTLYVQGRLQRTDLQKGGDPLVRNQ